MASKSPAVELEVDDKVVRISNPDRVYFPARGETKLDLVEYYLAVGDGIVNALYERPCMLHRFPTADELCVTEIAQVIWAVQMSTVEFHPWNSRRADTEKPDEWRIDLDPGPLCDYATVRRVAAGALGDLHGGIDDAVFDITPLLEWADRDGLD